MAPRREANHNPACNKLCSHIVCLGEQPENSFCVVSGMLCVHVCGHRVYCEGSEWDNTVSKFSDTRTGLLWVLAGLLSHRPPEPSVPRLIYTVSSLPTSIPNCPHRKLFVWIISRKFPAPQKGALGSQGAKKLVLSGRVVNFCYIYIYI